MKKQPVWDVNMPADNKRKELIFMKKIKFFNLLVILVVFGFTLYGCAVIGTTMLYKFQDKTIPLEEHCRLYVRHELLIEQFDEHKDTIFSPLGFGSGSINAVVSVITSGEHSFLVTYRHDGGDYETYAKNIPVSFNFKPGRFYFMYPIIEGNKIYIQIVDGTDSDEKGNGIIPASVYMRSSDRENMLKARDQSAKKMK